MHIYTEEKQEINLIDENVQWSKDTRSSDNYFIYRK